MKRILATFLALLFAASAHAASTTAANAPVMAGPATITGGTINGTTIGLTSSAAAEFTTLSSGWALDVTKYGTDSAAFTAAKAAQDRAIVVPKGAYTIGSSVSFDTFPARIVIDPHATFSGAGRILMDTLLPYHSDLISLDITAKVFDGTFPSYSDIFMFARYARVDSARKAVALYGEGEANFSGSNAWGINTAGIAAVSGATAIGAEITALSNSTGTATTGILIGGKGTNLNTAALQISSGASTNAFTYGINISNSGIKSSIDSAGTLFNADFTVATNGFNLLSSTFSGYEYSSPSLLIGATVASYNSRLQILNSASGLPSVSAVGHGGTPATNADVVVAPLGTGFLSVRNGTNRQSVKVYGTISGADYERLGINTVAANATTILQEQGGAGTARGLKVGTTGNTAITFVQNNVDRWTITSLELRPTGASNTYDVCAAGATCRSGYFATSLVTPALTGTSAALTLNNTSSGTLTFGSNAVTPASSGTRYLCISTAGVVTSSATACSGT